LICFNLFAIALDTQNEEKMGKEGTKSAECVTFFRLNHTRRVVNPFISTSMHTIAKNIKSVFDDQSGAFQIFTDCAQSLSTFTDSSRGKNQ
jgi:hypothetical protein